MAQVNFLLLGILESISLICCNYIIFIREGRRPFFFSLIFVLLIVGLFGSFGNFIYFIYFFSLFCINVIKARWTIVSYSNCLLACCSIFSIFLTNISSLFLNHIFFLGLPATSTIIIQIMFEIFIFIILLLFHTKILELVTSLENYVIKNNSLAKFQYLASVICIILIIVVIIAEQLNIEMQIQGILVLLMFVTINIASFIFIEFNKYQNRINQIKIAKRYVLQQQEYLSLKANDYEKLRKLRHDYINLLIVLEGLLNEGKIAQAKNYVTALNKAIPSLGKNYQEQTLLLNNIKSIEIKSLLLAKIQLMNKFKINHHIYFDTAKKVYISPSKILHSITILGNLIDNAIDETKNNFNGKIFIKIRNPSDNIFEFEISNSLNKKKRIQLDEITQYGFTTKKGHSGIGLAIIKEITDQHSDYTLETTCSENFIIFNFIVKGS